MDIERRNGEPSGVAVEVGVGTSYIRGRWIVKIGRHPGTAEIIVLRDEA